MNHFIKVKLKIMMNLYQVKFINHSSSNNHLKHIILKMQNYKKELFIF